MKFKFKELEHKSAQELHRILSESKDHLRDLKFKAAAKQLKNIADIAQTKKTIARILFLLKKQSNQPVVGTPAISEKVKTEK